MTLPALKNFLRQPAWLAAAAITIAIIWLHFFFLIRAGGLWRDEVNLVNLADTHSLAAMQKDSFPVLMPVLVGLWSSSGFAQTDVSLRLLGVLIGLGIPALFWAAMWTGRRSPPLISLVLLGLNANLIIYGDSLRPHGLGCLAIALTAVAMLAFLKNPSWSRAAVLALAATLSVQSLYQNAVLVAAVSFGGWVVCARRKNLAAALKILGAGIVAALSLLPYWQNLAGMPVAAESQRTGFSPALAAGNLDLVVAYPLSQYRYVWGLLALLVIGFAGAVWFTTRPKRATLAEATAERGDLKLFAGATLLATVIAFTGFLWYAALPTQPWYFLPPLVLVVMCFDLGISLPELPRLARTLLAGFIAASALIAIPYAHRDLNWHFTNIDRLARQLAAQAKPHDFIIVTPWYCGVSFDRYFKSPVPWQTLPPLADHTFHRYDLLREQMRTPHALQPVFNQMAMTLQSGHRVWVVGQITIPQPDTVVPDDLPMPPLKTSGWSDLPYNTVWTRQAAAFLADHSRQFQRVDHETNQNVAFEESLQLFSVAGWRPNQP